MSLGLHLIRALLEEAKGPAAITRAGLKKADFTKIEQEALGFYVDFWMQYQKVPEITTVEKSCSVRFPSVAESSDFYLDQMRKQRQITIARNARDILEERIQNLDTDAIKSVFMNASMELAKLQSNVRISELKDHIPGILAEHDRRAFNYVSEFPFGFPMLDKFTLGAQKGDFIIITGRPGSMKTYFMLHFAISSYLAGRRVLFLTLEMDAQKIARRASSILADLSEDRIRFGRMGFLGKHKLVKTVRDMQRSQSFLIMDGGLRATIEDTILQTQELQPDALYIDGAYILQTDTKYSGQAERLGFIFNRLRALALDLGIPVFISHQLNRQALKRGAGSVDHAYGTDAAGQYATLFMSLDAPVITKKFLNEEPIYKKLRIGKSRESLARYEYTIKFDPLRTTFTELNDDLDTEVLEEELEEVGNPED